MGAVIPCQHAGGGLFEKGTAGAEEGGHQEGVLYIEFSQNREAMNVLLQEIVRVFTRFDVFRQFFPEGGIHELEGGVFAKPGEGIGPQCGAGAGGEGTDLAHGSALHVQSDDGVKEGGGRGIGCGGGEVDVAGNSSHVVVFTLGNEGENAHVGFHFVWKNGEGAANGVEEVPPAALVGISEIGVSPLFLGGDFVDIELGDGGEEGEVAVDAGLGSGVGAGQFPQPFRGVEFPIFFSVVEFAGLEFGQDGGGLSSAGVGDPPFGAAPLSNGGIGNQEEGAVTAVVALTKPGVLRQGGYGLRDFGFCRFRGFRGFEKVEDFLELGFGIGDDEDVLVPRQIGADGEVGGCQGIVGGIENSAFAGFGFVWRGELDLFAADFEGGVQGIGIFGVKEDCEVCAGSQVRVGAGDGDRLDQFRSKMSYQVVEGECQLSLIAFEGLCIFGAVFEESEKGGTLFEAVVDKVNKLLKGFEVEEILVVGSRFCQWGWSDGLVMIDSVFPINFINGDACNGGDVDGALEVGFLAVAEGGEAEVSVELQVFTDGPSSGHEGVGGIEIVANTTALCCAGVEVQ